MVPFLEHIKQTIWKHVEIWELKLPACRVSFRKRQSCVPRPELRTVNRFSVHQGSSVGPGGWKDWVTKKPNWDIPYQTTFWVDDFPNFLQRWNRLGSRKGMWLSNQWQWKDWTVYKGPTEKIPLPPENFRQSICFFLWYVWWVSGTGVWSGDYSLLAALTCHHTLWSNFCRCAWGIFIKLWKGLNIFLKLSHSKNINQFNHLTFLPEFWFMFFGVRRRFLVSAVWPIFHHLPSFNLQSLGPQAL